MAKPAITGFALLRAALVGAAGFALLASPFAIGEAVAGVGVTSATDGDPLGKPPAEAERVLRIGIDVQANELITTQANDRAHLVFLDGSSLTVGPNAQVTIDRFVYDPATKTGDLAISASKGVLRLVGGRISKTHPIVITTPSSSTGIRGGNADQAAQNSGFSAANSGQSVRITGLQPGNNFGSGPGPRNWNPPNVVTNALDNANAEQQQQAQSQARSAPQFTSSPPLPPPPLPEINPLVPTPGSSPASVSDINALTSTATYKGSVVGVLNNGDLGRGSYQNVWNFGSRSGVATVTFGNTFGGGNTPNTFQRENSSNFGTNQPLPSTSGPARSLELDGGFVSSQGNVAGSQAGNFSINGPGYNVNGAFSGQK